MERLLIKELKDFSDEFKRKINLYEGTKICLDNFTQAQVVCYIDDCKDREISQRDLEKFLNLSKSSVSSLLDTLEKKHAIRREASKCDARKNVIKLSKSTVESIKHVEENILNINNRIISNIDEDKLNIFFEVLETMKNNIGKEDKND